MTTFEYDGETIYTSSIDIDDMYQCCLEAEDSQGMFYYLIIRTALGQSSCLEYGPVVPDLDKLPNETSIKFQRLDCEDSKIKFMIKNFLKNRNKGKVKIVSVNEVDFNYALNQGVNLLDYMKNFNDISNY